MKRNEGGRMGYYAQQKMGSKGQEAPLVLTAKINNLPHRIDIAKNKACLDF